MTGKGTITRLPSRSTKRIILLQLLWLGVVFTLGAWWVNLVIDQADRITHLQSLLEGSPGFVPGWVPSQKMLFWESGTFFVLLLGVSGLLFWLYWRDMTRTRSLQAFFASVTHELKTPLTSIRLQAESISEAASRNDLKSLEPLARRLLEDSARLETQVERTLELARIEGGGPLYLQSIRLKSWIERFISLWKDVRENAPEVSLEIPEDLTLLADPGALQVILKNLLENSERHAGTENTNGGMNKLRIRIEALEGREHVEIRFSDNGKGYAGNPRALGGLFQKGERSSGAGVGLYLVRTLMERMGGEARFSTGQLAGHGFEVNLRFQVKDQHGAGSNE